MVAFSATVISAMNVFVYHIVQIEITINFISHVMSQVVFITKNQKNIKQYTFKISFFIFISCKSKQVAFFTSKKIHFKLLNVYKV